MALAWFVIIIAEGQPVDNEKLFESKGLHVQGPDRAFSVEYSGCGLKRALETLASSFRYRAGRMPVGMFRH